MVLSLDEVKHLMVVPDGPLESISFGVLVREVPKKEIDEFQEYRDVRWLARDYALTRLPAVSSLPALRTFSEPVEQLVPFGETLIRAKCSDVWAIPDCPGGQGK